MKKITLILSISIVSAYIFAGCTMMPASLETGVGPEEYAEIKNTEAIKKENEDLKNELNNIKSEVEKMESEYLELAKNNETVLSKLEEAESKLDILENEGIPQFNSEKTDKNSIMSYLNNNKSVLEERLKGIEILDNSDESSVLFYTTGYGDALNQLFIWKVGESEPILIDGADFEKDGKLNWINNKFLEINTGKNEYKILDADSNSIVCSFISKQDAYLIPETSSYIIQDKDTNKFLVYDFINTKEQEIDLDNKGKFTAFEINSDNIIFSGSYSDEYKTQYSLEAVMNLETLKEKYNILSLDEAIEIKENNDDTTEIIESTETTDEGTV